MNSRGQTRCHPSVAVISEAANGWVITNCTSPDRGVQVSRSHQKTTPSRTRYSLGKQELKLARKPKEKRELVKRKSEIEDRVAKITYHELQLEVEGDR
jgi:hypothetical protein